MTKVSIQIKCTWEMLKREKMNGGAMGQIEKGYNTDGKYQTSSLTVSIR